MNPTFPKCIITGCQLFDELSQRSAHGDLFELGDTYIFNACVHEGETAWTFHTAVPTHPLALILQRPEYFERRGVVVVHKALATLSPEAVEYTTRGARRELAR